LAAGCCQAGIEDARPHDFRHAFGTFAAQTGAKSFLVRDALGHDHTIVDAS
jgi:integrase